MPAIPRSRELKQLGNESSGRDSTKRPDREPVARQKKWEPNRGSHSSDRGDNHSLNKNPNARNKLPPDTQKESQAAPQIQPLDQPACSAHRALSDARAGGPSIEEHWLPLAGGRMRYLKTGAGPALILVHGLMGYSFSWRFTMPALAPHATVYAIDNLGAGLSPARLSSSASDLDCTVRAPPLERVSCKFADALGLAEFDLLGTSHGGAVAMMAAAAQRRPRTAPNPGCARQSLVTPRPNTRALSRQPHRFLALPLHRGALARVRPPLAPPPLRRREEDSTRLPRRIPHSRSPESWLPLRLEHREDLARRPGRSRIGAAENSRLSHAADLGNERPGSSFASAEPLRKNFTNACVARLRRSRPSALRRMPGRIQPRVDRISAIADCGCRFEDLRKGLD